MKESNFIEQNNQKWQELEAGLYDESKDPRIRGRLFIKIIEDLSYVHTFYKRGPLLSYLNGMAQVLFSDLNLNKVLSLKRLLAFFTQSFPKAMYVTRRSMLVSLVIFLLSFAIGSLTASGDKEFASQILSSGYIEMTEENIEKGDPMAVYKGMGEIEMFLKIAINNLRVAFLTFIFGLLSSIGSIFILITNGVMVGVFQFFFIERELFLPSFLTIWTHGTIEISCIIVAGGAGIQLGKGLLFPGTYSRAEAFKMSAKSALVVFTGITPLIILAAFIEAFQTRHTEIPDAIRMGFILLCLAFVLFYFFWYPRKKYGADGKHFDELEQKPSPGSRTIFSTKKIFSADQLFAFCIGHLLRFSKNAWLLLGLSILFALTITYSPEDVFTDAAAAELSGFRFSSMFQLGSFIPMNLLVIALMSTILASTSLFHAKTYTPEEAIVKKNKFKTILASIVVSILLYSTLSFATVGTTLLFPFLAALLLQALAIGNLEKGSLISGSRTLFYYLRSNWGKFLLLNLILVILYACYSLVVNSFVLPLVAPTIAMLVTDELLVERQVNMLLSAAFGSFGFFSLLYFVNLGAHLLYFSLREANTAEHLFTRIKTVLID